MLAYIQVSLVLLSSLTALSAHAQISQIRNPTYETALAQGIINARGIPEASYAESVWSDITSRGLVTADDLKNLEEGKTTRNDIMRKYDRRFMCATFAPIQVSLNGKTYNRFRFTRGGHLSCIDRGTYPAAPWPVRSAQWSSADELEFQAFVQRIGNSRCTNVDECLTDPQINPYVDETDMLGSHYSDCADFPVFLRCYFAWKKGLTCAQPAATRGNPLRPAQQRTFDAEIARFQARTDLTPEQREQLIAEYTARNTGGNYAVNGNYPVSQPAILPLQTGGLRVQRPQDRNFFLIMRNMVDTVSSGNFRMLKTLPSQNLPAFYSPKINERALTPGVIAYDASGHVGVAFSITSDGSLRLLDAHPDNSVSRKTFGPTWRRSFFSQGDGLKKWRPYQVSGLSSPGPLGLEWSPQARLTLVPDSQISDFSLEQYLGHVQTNPILWNGVVFCQSRNGACLTNDQGEPLPNLENRVTGENKSWFVITPQGRLELTFFDYTKIILSGGQKIKPLREFESQLNELCTVFQGRTNSATGDSARAMSETSILQLPPNIFQSSQAPEGWFDVSTPMSDTRLKARILDIVAFVKRAHNGQQRNAPEYDFEGQNFKNRAIEIYGQVSNSCNLSYRNSNGELVRGSLSGAVIRAVRNSFIPQLCVEMRMGALSPIELRTCNIQPGEMALYEGTRKLFGADTVIDTSRQYGQTVEELAQASRRLGEPDVTPFRIDKALSDLN